MSGILPYGERRMTVREVAEALGTAESTIRNKAAELFPEVVRNGVTTYLDQEQVTALKQSLVPRDLTLKSKVDAATTDIEMMERTVQVIQWQMAKLEEQRARIAELEPKAAVADAIALASDCKTISEVGKITGIGPHKLGDLLEADGVLFRKHYKGGAKGERVPYEVYMERGYFVVRERVFSGRRGEVLRRSQTYVTGKGEVWIAQRYTGGEPVRLDLGRE